MKSSMNQEKKSKVSEFHLFFSFFFSKNLFFFAYSALDSLSSSTRAVEKKKRHEAAWAPEAA